MKYFELKSYWEHIKKVALIYSIFIVKRIRTINQGLICRNLVLIFTHQALKGRTHALFCRCLRVR